MWQQQFLDNLIPAYSTGVGRQGSDKMVGIRKTEFSNKHVTLGTNKLEPSLPPVIIIIFHFFCAQASEKQHF